MKLPILYKRKRPTAIEYWEVEVTGRSDKAIITKWSGLYGSEEVTRDIELINQVTTTTPLEQAKRQAEEDWKKKRDEGYKSLDDLGIDYDEDMGAWSFNGAHYTGFLSAIEKALQLELQLN